MDMERGLAFVLAKLERTHHVVDTLKRDIASQSVSKFGYDSPIAPSSGLDLGFINRDAEAVRESTFKRLRCDSGDCHAVKAAISNEIQVTNSEPPLISGTQHNPINTLEATGTIETQANERCTEESAHQEENKSDNQAKFGFYHSGFYVHLAEYDGSHWIKYGATQRVGKRVNITPFKNVAHVAEVFAAEKGDRTVAKKKGWEEDWNQIMEKLSE
ncbi:hypothetical protein HDU79_011747 [Rhizoclosmatium sp. JEL0117]|nr:hypothetical protein HDU79_011747 [Rhizoclosmatium sp. JEL0117]